MTNGAVRLLMMLIVFAASVNFEYTAPLFISLIRPNSWSELSDFALPVLFAGELVCVCKEPCRRKYDDNSASNDNNAPLN